MAPEEQDRRALEAWGARLLPEGEAPFHFGRELVRAAGTIGRKAFAYFGGGSAPLMTEEALAEVFARVARAREPLALVNNLHSSDWVVMNCAQALDAHSHRFPKDNSLGWVLWKEAGISVEARAPSAATRRPLG